MTPIIIAVDGYSSSGKSSMAKRLAREIGYRYVDSGAMYRAVTLWAMRNGLVRPDGSIKEDTLIASLPEIHIDFKVDSNGQSTLLNGENVEHEIRTLEVSSHVSPVAAIPAVRHSLVLKQQEFGNKKGIVMDGRDIGTTVFPDAEMKVFVTASPETRAERRYKELTDKGIDTTFDEVLSNVIERDRIDETRAESPLRRADDAILLDNSNMTVEQQSQWLKDLYNQIISRHENSK